MLEATAYVGALVVILAVSHGLARLMSRGGLRWVWTHWNLVGAVLLVAGLHGIGGAWFFLGLTTTAGSAVAGAGILLASAGFWMLCWT
ncbi:MAG: hypothetical protein HYV62_00450 [Candidatus Rokubacteria bacterium]|nr:hypothetical protein [Candidatus Rokubacteria bacterium]